MTGGEYGPVSLIMQNLVTVCYRFGYRDNLLTLSPRYFGCWSTMNKGHPLPC